MSDIDNSILNTVKRGLMGVTDNYEAFDEIIILHINTVFSVLEQVGVGPEGGYSISGEEETWADYLGANEQMLELVKNFMLNRVKLAFDPPSSSFVLSSLEKQTEELIWRIKVKMDTINATT